MQKRQIIGYLSFDEWERLISSIPDRHDSTRDYVILRTLYETGCTVNELANIKIKDIDFSRCIIRVPAENSRNHHYREASISQRLCQALREIALKNKKSEYLLYSRQSKSMTTKRIRQIVQQLCENIGIKNANPQLLRYTHIAHAYMRNVPVDAIQKQVGLMRSRAIEIFSQLEIASPKDAYKRFLD